MTKFGKLWMVMVAALAFSLTACEGCGGANQAWVDADRSTFELFTKPVPAAGSAPAIPEGRLKSWIDRDQKEGKISELEADLLRKKLESWAARISEFGKP